MGSKQSSRTGLKSLLILTPILAVLLVLFLCLKRKKPAPWITLLQQSRYNDIWPILVAQAKHETGNFTSKLSREANNIFGHKTFFETRFPVPEKERALNEPNYYREFATLEDSAQAQVDWLTRHKIPIGRMSVEDYANFIRQEGFYTDSAKNYIAGLKRFL